MHCGAGAHRYKFRKFKSSINYAHILKQFQLKQFTQMNPSRFGHFAMIIKSKMMLSICAKNFAHLNCLRNWCQSIGLTLAHWNEHTRCMTKLVVHDSTAINWVHINFNTILMGKVLSILNFIFCFGAKKVISTRHKINRPSSSYQYWWHWWSTDTHLLHMLACCI